MSNEADNILAVDARGLACPEPLMRARSAMTRAKGGAVGVRVDTATSRDNIRRMVLREGRDFEAAADGDSFILRIGAKKV